MSTQAQRGAGYIAQTHSQPRRQREVCGQQDHPTALPPRKTRCQLYRRSGVSQGRSRRARKSGRHRNSISGRSRPQRVTILTTLSRPLPDTTTESKFQGHERWQSDIAAGSSHMALKDYPVSSHSKATRNHDIYIQSGMQWVRQYKTEFWSSMRTSPPKVI
jgi:hypothetical protein